ncbi:ankyrin [Xylaria digitata]|nr:ankyrin [Xylaria digitata]
MHLFELPPELVHLIFEHIIKSRQFERVMRIRIVSRQFKTYIDYLIFRLRLLSQMFDSFRNPESLFRRKPAFLSYVRSYLVYQVLREKSTTSRLGRIYRAAKAVCEIEGNTGDEAVMTCINSLVRLAMSGYTYELLREPIVKPNKCSDKELEADLYVAAIYLDKQFYVEGLIADGIEFCDIAGRPDVHSTVFGKAFSAAIRQGNLGMIKLLLSCNAEYRDTGFIPARERREILRSAGFYGHQDAFNFALDMRPINLPEEPERRVHSDARALERVIRSMPFPQSYERVAAILGPDSKVFGPYHFGTPTGWLEQWARLGEVDMLRYILDKGANPNCTEPSCIWTPLLSAIGSDNEAIIRILLEAGADPNVPHPPHLPLMEAVWVGNVAVVKLLLSHGADVHEGCPAPVVIAAFKERMDLFRLLTEHGARLDTPETGGWAMALAKWHGLSSMVDVLVREGVGQDVVLHWVPTNQQHWWRHNLWPRQ